MGTSDDKNQPASTLARSFSAQLNDIFLLDDSLEQLDKTVEQKKLEVSKQNAELEALEARLREAERRLKGKGSDDGSALSPTSPTSPTSSNGSGISRGSRRRPIPSFDPDDAPAAEGAAEAGEGGGGSTADGASEPSKKDNPVALAPRALPASGGRKEANQFLVGGNDDESERGELEGRRGGGDSKLRGEEKIKEGLPSAKNSVEETNLFDRQGVKENNDDSREFKPLTLNYDLRREDTVTSSTSSFGRTDSTKSAASTGAPTATTKSTTPASVISNSSNATTPKLTSPLVSPQPTAPAITNHQQVYPPPSTVISPRGPTSAPSSHLTEPNISTQYANQYPNQYAPSIRTPRSPGHMASPSAETIPIVFDDGPYIPPASTMPIPTYYHAAPKTSASTIPENNNENDKPPPPPKPQSQSQSTQYQSLIQPHAPPQPPPPPSSSSTQPAPAATPTSPPAPLNATTQKPLPPYINKVMEHGYQNGAPNAAAGANSSWSDSSADSSKLSGNYSKHQEATTSPTTQSTLQSKMENFSQLSKEVGKGGLLKMKKSLTGLRKKAAGEENTTTSSRSSSQDRPREGSRSDDLPPLPPLPQEAQQQSQQPISPPPAMPQQLPQQPQQPYHHFHTDPQIQGSDLEHAGSGNDKFLEAQKKLELANKKAAEAFSKLSVKVRGFRRRREEKEEGASPQEPPLADWEREEKPHVPKARWPHLASAALGRSNSFTGLRKRADQPSTPDSAESTQPLPALPPPSITIPRKPVPSRAKQAVQGSLAASQTNSTQASTSLTVESEPQRPTTADSRALPVLLPPVEAERPKTSPEPTSSSSSVPPRLELAYQSSLSPPPLPGKDDDDDDEAPPRSSSSSRVDAISPQLPVRGSWIRSDKSNSTFMGDFSFDSFDASKLSDKAAEPKESSSSLAPPRKVSSNQRESMISNGRSETYSFLGDYYFDNNQLSPTKESLASPTRSKPGTSPAGSPMKETAGIDSALSDYGAKLTPTDTEDSFLDDYLQDDDDEEEEEEKPPAAPAVPLKFPPRVTSLSSVPARTDSRGSTTASLRTESRVTSLKESAQSVARSPSGSLTNSPVLSGSGTGFPPIKSASTPTGNQTSIAKTDNDGEEIDGVAPLASRTVPSSGTRSPYTSGGGSSMHSSSGFSEAETITTDRTSTSSTVMKHYNPASATAVRVSKADGMGRGYNDGPRTSAQVVDIASPTGHGRMPPPGSAPPSGPPPGPPGPGDSESRGRFLSRSDSRGRQVPFPINRPGQHPAYAAASRRQQQQQQAPPMPHPPRSESPFGNHPPRSSSRMEGGEGGGGSRGPGGRPPPPHHRQPPPFDPLEHSTDWMPQIPETRMRSRSGPAPRSGSPARFAGPGGMPMPPRRAESPGPRSHSPGPGKGPGRPPYMNRSESPGPGPRFRREGGPRERRGSTNSNATDFSERGGPHGGGGGGGGRGMNIPMDNVGMAPQKRYRPPQQYMGGGPGHPHHHPHHHPHGPVPAGQHPPSSMVPGRGGYGPPRGGPPRGGMGDGRMPGRGDASLMMMDGRMPS